MKATWTFGQKNEYLFKSKYCRFKIWFGMKNRNNKTYYGIETNCTPLQIATGHIKEVVFDKQKGYDNCLQLEQQFRDRYDTAIIYQKQNGQWVELKKYRHGQLAESSEPDMSHPITLARVAFDPNGQWYMQRVQQPMARTPPPSAPPPSKAPAFRVASQPTSAGEIARRAYGFTP